MKKPEELIGKTILSHKFGSGLVVAVEDLSNAGKPFLVVESDEGKIKNFIAFADEQSYRELLGKEQFEKTVNKLSPKVEGREFASKKDRISFFKTESKIQELDQIITLINELNSMTDRSSAEEQILTELTESLAFEHSLVLGTEVAASKEVILGKLQGEKK